MMGPNFEAYDTTFKPAYSLCTPKVGDELFVDAPDAEEDRKIRFAFGIALNEPEVTEGEPLLELVQHFADLVSNIASGFKPLLA